MDTDFDELLINEQILSKLSDITRIVDPIRKTAKAYSNNGNISKENKCFDFWGKDKICDNCISMRAYNNNETYLKIEHQNDNAYLIIAIPYAHNNSTIVVEIIKIITNSMFFDVFEKRGSQLTNIHSLINSINELAFSDPLTGLFNRRYVLEKLPVDLLNATLLSKELSLIMADIDHFKVINDTYGHLAGDKTLKEIALALSGCLKRSGDWIARYGGEEFLICMPGGNLETAKKTAECMRKSIESTMIEYNDKLFSVTISFGVYNLKLSESVSIEELIKHADDKLYMAKSNGRNRVEY